MIPGIDESHPSILTSRTALDLKDIPDNVLGDIDVRPVRWIDEVLEVALSRQPVPYVADDAAQAVAQDEEPGDKERPSAH